jgi:putative oxidoreductase
MIFRAVDSIGMRLDGLWLLLGRVGLGALFAWSGARKLMDPTGLTGMLTSKGWPAPMAMAYLAGAVEVIGGVLLVIGLKARSAAFALIVFTIIATILAHAFWQLDGAARIQQQIQFFKNVAIIGGLLFVFGRGAGPLSADRG